MPSQGPTVPVDELIRRVKATAGGMLSIDVYRRVYERARAFEGGAIVEIGTALGAATIVLALGAKASGKPFHVYTADPFAGRYSSRSKFGSPEENIAHVRQQLQAYGVADVVTLVVGTSQDLVSAHDPNDIGFLFLDADGRIDRDLSVLASRLRTGAAMVVDDVDAGAYLSQSADGSYYVDLKHHITGLLLGRMKKRGILAVQEMAGNTAFCEWTGGDVDELQALALDAYRELVFVPLDEPRWQRLIGLHSAGSRATEALNFYSRVPKPVLGALRGLNRARRRLVGPRTTS